MNQHKKLQALPIFKKERLMINVGVIGFGHLEPCYIINFFI